MDFKKTLLIICFFVGYNTVAQNQLQFNRVIDTVLSITIPSGVNMNKDVNNNPTAGITYGDFISPPNGKDWKVESIILSSPMIFESMILYCGGGQYSSGWGTYLRIQSVIRDESIITSLKEREPTTDPNSNFLDSPIWINNAELGIAFRSLIDEDVCLTQPYTGYVFLSIIEFNTD